MSLNNIVIVTGASRGIGRQIALYLLSKDVSVVGLALNGDALLALEEEAPKLSDTAKFIPVIGDVTDEAVQQQAVAAAVKTGTLVALVNNAAVVEPYGKVATTDLGGWSKILAINVVAPVGMIQKSLPHLRQTEGRVINLTSIASKVPFLNMSSYGASKAALNHVNELLGLEEPRITAVVIDPGIADTDMLDLVIDGAERSGEEGTAALNHINGNKIGAELPGRVIGNLALYADHSLSGKFVAYGDPELDTYAQ
ncbi:NAD(P)-binding protein [Linderina pennispora]|uniref:NAD(P)-binding protein n=1 Tax=Linderina pennispora TaxID=61395 RepID=A0A1Y1W171_9FUNG|nr:NAD(P)-binding protein [Linderina pennispora]ORX67283.1 NAD(P)-binding protein [Linderina pennispora]